MAIEHKSEPSTGIYQFSETEYTGDDAIAALRKIAEHDAYANEHWLDDAEAQIEVLHALCVPLRDERIAAGTIRQLDNALHLCHTVRLYTKSGNAKAALRYAFELGRLIEAATVRVNAEWAAGVGKRQVKNAAKGSVKAHGTPEERRVDATRRLLLWQSARLRHPLWTLAALDHAVALADGCSASTVKKNRLSQWK